MNYSDLFYYEPFYNKDIEYDTDWAVWRDDSEKKLYVRFQGTTSIKDVLVDILIYQSKVEAFDGAKWYVHAGFKKAYYSVRNKVLDKCYELYKDGDEIIILGHSLGGAISLLATEDIGWHFKKKVCLIT